MEEYRRRLWISLGLAFGSPLFAVLLSVSVIAVGSRVVPGFDNVSAIAFFADGAFAAVGSAADALLLPAAPMPGRVALAVAFAPAAFFAHWVLGVIALVLIYGF